MLIQESVREFQKQMTQYINGNDIVIIEDGKTHQEKGVFMPFNIYSLFKEQMRLALREDIKNSFTESFDGVGAVNEH